MAGIVRAGTPRKGRILAIVAVVLLALGAGVYFLVWRRTSPAPADVRTATEQAVAPTAPTRPLPEAGEVIDLPPIDQTDAIVRELVARLSSHPTVAAWLTTDKLIRNFTVVVENISTGRTPSGQLGKVRPTGASRFAKMPADLWIDPRSYRRYDKYADAVAASTLAARRACTPRSSLESRTVTATSVIPTATSTRRSSAL